mmetsp:Transcript_31997/g.52844  ORF Transcript_31997/g.52844 Transcript_31997/m.52844 type:complete len:216 (-) Transcript_31997:4246-4893(-)
MVCWCPLAVQLLLLLIADPPTSRKLYFRITTKTTTTTMDSAARAIEVLVASFVVPTVVTGRRRMTNRRISPSRPLPLPFPRLASNKRILMIPLRILRKKKRNLKMKVTTTNRLETMTKKVMMTGMRRTKMRNNQKKLLVSKRWMIGIQPRIHITRKKRNKVVPGAWRVLAVWHHHCHNHNNKRNPAMVALEDSSIDSETITIVAVAAVATPNCAP